MHIDYPALLEALTIIGVIVSAPELIGVLS